MGDVIDLTKKLRITSSSGTGVRREPTEEEFELIYIAIDTLVVVLEGLGVSTLAIGIEGSRPDKYFVITAEAHNGLTPEELLAHVKSKKDEPPSPIA